MTERRFDRYPSLKPVAEPAPRKSRYGSSLGHWSEEGNNLGEAMMNAPIGSELMTPEPTVHDAPVIDSYPFVEMEPDQFVHTAQAIAPTPPNGLRRRCYYSARVDPLSPDYHMRPESIAKFEEEAYSGTLPEEWKLQPPTVTRPYNLVSSLADDGLHYIAWDVDLSHVNVLESDVKCKVYDAIDLAYASLYNAMPMHYGLEDLIVVRSTNHYHVYCDAYGYSWPQYVYLMMLVAEGEQNLLEMNYVLATINSGQSLLRPAHIKKTEPQEPF